MTIWTRAAIVLSAVGVALLALAAFATAGEIRAGAGAVTLVPLLLGVGLKGTLALLAAAVMAHAARLEAKRARLQATRSGAPGRTAAPSLPPVRATPPRRPAGAPAAKAGEGLEEAA